MEKAIPFELSLPTEELLKRKNNLTANKNQNIEFKQSWRDEYIK